MKKLLFALAVLCSFYCFAAPGGLTSPIISGGGSGGVENTNALTPAQNEQLTNSAQLPLSQYGVLTSLPSNAVTNHYLPLLLGAQAQFTNILWPSGNIFMQVQMSSGLATVFYNSQVNFWDQQKLYNADGSFVLNLQTDSLFGNGLGVTNTPSSTLSSTNGSVTIARSVNPITGETNYDFTTSSGGSGSVFTNNSSSASLQTRDFTPTSISGLQVWLRGTTLTNTPTATNIVFWQDISGNGNNATNGTASTAPSYKQTFDGRYAASFASGNFLRLPNTLSILSTNYSVFAVVRYKELLNDTIGGCTIDLGSGLQNMFWMNGGVGNQMQVYNGSSDPISGPVQGMTSAFEVMGLNSSISNLEFRLNDYTFNTQVPLGNNTLIGGSIGSENGSAGFYLSGDIQEIVIYNRSLTESEERSLVSYFNRPYANRQVIADGDSLTAGYNSVLAFKTPLEWSYPWQLNRIIGESTKMNNYGVVGQTLFTEINNVTNNYLTTIDTNQFPQGNIVIQEGGGNDILATTNASSVFDQNSNYCSIVHASGGKVIVSTLLPRVDLITTNPQFTNWLSYNAQMRAGWTNFADGFVDLASTTIMGNSTNQYTNTFYYGPDGVHLNYKGYEFMARAFLPEVNRLSVNTSTVTNAFQIPIIQSGSTNLTLVGATTQGILFLHPMLTTNYIPVVVLNGATVAGAFTSNLTTNGFTQNMTALTFTGNMLWSVTSFTK